MTEPSFPISDAELAELTKADQDEATDDIEIDDDDDEADYLDETDESEVTEANFEDFLPSQDPHEVELDEDGALTDEEQAAYDEDPPEPQDSYEEGEGL